MIFDNSIDKILIQTCKEITEQYEINIIELGIDSNFVHFLIQAVLAILQIIKIIKNIKAKEIYGLYIFSS